MAGNTRTTRSCTYKSSVAGVICVLSGAASSCVLGFSGEGDAVGVQPVSY